MMEEHVEEHVEEDLLEESFLSSCPRIFEGKELDPLPPNFDAVTIHLDGRVQADLDWKKERKFAQNAVEKGYTLLWDIQLGLFQGLAQPLINQTQFLSLTLSLEHFRDSLWKEFKSHTLGCSLFRGSADFSQAFPWDSHQEQSLKGWLQEIGEPHLASFSLTQLQQHPQGQQLVRLYCRDVAVEYLTLLASRLPDTLSTYLYLDASSLASSSIHEIQLLNPERFDRLHLALKGHHLPFEAWGWGKPTARGYSGHFSFELPLAELVTIGICIPPMNLYQAHHYQGLEEGIQALQKRSLPFKLIAESHLTSQWDGLDVLIYCPSGLSLQGKRKLQGFCAAGGRVVSTGILLGLPNEVSLMDWLINL